MLEKSGEVDGIHIEWHTFHEGGKEITACFSDPDAPLWEFWCGDRHMALFIEDEGALNLCLLDEIKRPLRLMARNQHHVQQGFIWLLGGKKPKHDVHVQ